MRGEAGIITSESPAASGVGLSVLNGGGNAVDAAVATTFALNAARPQSCGVGGGGFMVYRGANGETAALGLPRGGSGGHRARYLCRRWPLHDLYRPHHSRSAVRVRGCRPRWTATGL